MEGNDAFSAFGAISTVGKIKLPATSADMLCSGRLGRNLAEQVYFETVIDGDKVIQLSYYARVIDI